MRRTLWIMLGGAIVGSLGWFMVLSGLGDQRDANGLGSYFCDVLGRAEEGDQREGKDPDQHADAGEQHLGMHAVRGGVFARRLHRDLQRIARVADADERRARRRDGLYPV